MIFRPLIRYSCGYYVQKEKMEHSGNHIKDIIEKFIVGIYTLDELEQLLAYLQREEYALLETDMLEQWETILQQPGLESEIEKKAFKFEALQIVGHAPVIETQHTKVRHILPGYFWKIAILLTIILTVVSSGNYWFFGKHHVATITTMVMYDTLTTGYGEQKEIMLADGTVVNLNAGSQLIFPNKFSKDIREVYLFGEAFFHVAPDSLHQFIVHSPDAMTEVLGTSFNIKDYVKDDYSVITVMTGKVNVISNGRTIDLLAGEQLYMMDKASDFNKQMVDADKYSQWRRGELYLDQTPIFEVVKILHRQYGVDILLKCDSAVTISGRHDNKNLEAVLESICFTTKMKYTKDNNEIILYK